MPQAELMEVLEPLIDRATVGDVLFAMARVCNEKAEHLQVNWQDSRAAKQWDSLAARIDRLANTTNL